MQPKSKRYSQNDKFDRQIGEQPFPDRTPRLQLRASLRTRSRSSSTVASSSVLKLCTKLKVVLAGSAIDSNYNPSDHLKKWRRESEARVEAYNQRILDGVCGNERVFERDSTQQDPSSQTVVDPDSQVEHQYNRAYPARKVRFHLLDE